MRRRLGTISLILFQVVWLNVILPGHRRGVVTLPGTAAAANTNCESPPQPAHGCCKAAPAISGTDGASDQQPAKPGNAANCAICQYAAGLVVPHTIDVVPAPVGLAEASRLVRSRTVEDQPLARTYDACGPPVL